MILSLEPKLGVRLVPATVMVLMNEENTMKIIYFFLTVVSILLMSRFAAASEYEGTVKAGYIYSDIEGNFRVNQPTFNLYEGVTLSLEKFYYKLDNGIRLNGDFQNITLGNRRLRLGISKPGVAGSS